MIIDQELVKEQLSSFDPETKAAIAAKDYDTDYLEENQDAEIDLATDSLERPHRVTSTNLLKDKLFIDSARHLYSMFAKPELPDDYTVDDIGELVNQPPPDQSEISDEDIAEWGLELAGYLEWNLPDLGMAAYKIQGAPIQQRASLFSLMQKYEQLPNFTWDGSMRMLKGMGTDLSSYIGLSTLGSGFLVRQAAKEAGKTGIKAHLKALLPTAVLAGIESGAYTSIDDAARQYISIAATDDLPEDDSGAGGSSQTDFNTTQNVISAGIGTVAGAAIATVLPAVPMALKAGASNFANAFNAVADSSAQRLSMGAGPTPSDTAANATRSTGVERGERTTQGYKLKPGERALVVDAATKVNAKPSVVQKNYKDTKSKFPKSDGWADIEINKVVIKKGQPEVEFKKIPYSFNQTKTADELSDKMVEEVLQLKSRVDQGDPIAAGIWDHRSWYSEMRQRLRAEFGGFGDVFADVIGTTSAQTNVQQNWENSIEVMRRFTRGEFDGALTKLDAWLKAGKPMGSGKVTGDGYVDEHYKIRKQVEEAAVADGMSEDAASEMGFAAAQEEFPLIVKQTGKLFNANSPATMQALLGLFRDMKVGSSPKTPNFTGNLIGFSNYATIDVWAARNLRRLAGLDRIPVPAEQGVGGAMAEKSTQGPDGKEIKELKPDGEFGFGQDVYRETTAKLRERGIELNDDDLQAVVWFMEKEIWTKNNWTTKAGEGGSVATEADFAGVWNPEGVKSARSTLSSTAGESDRKKLEQELNDPKNIEAYEASVAELKNYEDFIAEETLAKRRNFVMANENIEDKDLALARVKEIKATITKLNRNISKFENLQPRIDKRVEKRAGVVAEAEQVLERKVPVRRLLGGISLQEKGKIPTDKRMNASQGRMLETINPDPTVLMMRATPTKGRYINPKGEIWDERAIDFEYIARENHDPKDAVRQMVQEAKDANQESAFFSEVVAPGTVEDANPGLEVYFNRVLTEEDVDKVTKFINSTKVDAGFTFATDLRQAQMEAGGEQLDSFVGVRLQYIPELAEKSSGADHARPLNPTRRTLKGINDTPDDIQPPNTEPSASSRLPQHLVPLTDTKLNSALPTTKYLVEKIKDKVPDAEMALSLSKTKVGESNYLTLTHPNKPNIEIRFSDHGTGERRSTYYAEQFPNYIPESGKPLFGKISRDSFDKSVDKVMSYYDDLIKPNASKNLTLGDENGKINLKETRGKIQDLVDSLPEEMDFVSSAQYTEYDTEIFFRDAGDYDAELTGSIRRGRRAKWRGEQVREGGQVTDGSP